MAKFKKREKHTHEQQRVENDAVHQTGHNQSLYAYLAVFAFAFLLYSNTLNHDVALDDDVITKANRYVQQGLEGIPSIFSKGFYHGFNNVNEGSYRPLVLLNMAIEKEYWDNDPHVGHIFNVLFYALSCILVLAFLKALFKGQGSYIPMAITLLYVAHPIHTEVVANVKSRDEILCFLFIILALYLLLQYINSSKKWILGLGMLAYFLSLLTKEYGITMLAVIPIMLHVYGSDEVSGKRNLSLTVLFGLVAGLYLIIRSSVMDNLAFDQEMDIINNSLAGANSFSERIATAILILGKYIGLLIFPHPLSFDYSYNQIPIVTWTNPGAILSFLLYAVLGVAGILAAKKREILAFGIAFYLFSLVIVSNLFVEIGVTLAERVIFMPSLGFCVVVTLLLAKVTRFSELTVKGRIPFYSIIAITLILYSFKTYSRNKEWENNFTLFTADITASPNSARTHFSLGSMLNTNSEFETNPEKKKAMLLKAIESLGRCLEIYPEFSAAWYNMGVAYYSLGDEKNALISYDNCLKIAPNDKQALNNSGVIYFNNKEYDTAMGYFLKTVKAYPNFPDPYANIGAVYHNQGNYQEAIKYYNKALEFNPNNRMVIGNLAKLYNSLGDVEKSNYYSSRSQ